MCANCKSKRNVKGQKRSAVARKQKASNTGPKPSNVRTLASKRWLHRFIYFW